MKTKLFLIACVSAVPVGVADADPIVSMTRTANIGGTGDTAYDFFYTPTPEAEFTNYRLTVSVDSGGGILDPIRGSNGQQDESSDAIDTFANTVGSFFGIGNASYNFNAYDPSGFSPDPVPTDFLDWSVFDTLDDDSAENVGGTPWHLARVLTSDDAVGTATFRAFDTLTNDGKTFDFNVVPEPTSLALLGLGGLALLGRRRHAKP